MSGFQSPPTQLQSAVSPDVPKMIASAGQMNLQQQQINNRAAAEKARLDAQQQMAREKMESQEFMTGEALKQRQAQALLQTANYQKLNQNNMDIARMRSEDAAAGRQEQARQFNERQNMAQQIHDETMNMQKADKQLELDIFLAERWDDPDALARMQESKANLMDRVLKMEQAKQLRAGKETDLGKMRLDAARNIESMAKDLRPLITNGLASIQDELAFADMPDGMTENMISNIFGEGTRRVIGDISETILEFGTLTFADMAGPEEEGLAKILDQDPHLQVKASAGYFSSMVSKALTSAFPEANTQEIERQLSGLFASSDDASFEESQNAMQALFQDNGINPMVAGEIMKKISEEVSSRRREIMSQYGVSSNMSRDQINEDQVMPFIQAKLLAGAERFYRFAAASESLAPYETWAEGIRGGDLNEVSEVLRQLQEGGVGGAGVMSVVDAMERIERMRRDELDSERDLVMEEDRIQDQADTLRRDAELERTERIRQAIERRSDSLQ